MLRNSRCASDLRVNCVKEMPTITWAAEDIVVAVETVLVVVILNQARVCPVLRNEDVAGSRGGGAGAAVQLCFC